jgi:hypothetical protein
MMSTLNLALDMLGIDQCYLKPQCVICGDVLANSNLIPSILWQHLESRRPTQTNEPVDSSKLKMIKLKSGITNFISVAANN